MENTNSMSSEIEKYKVYLAALLHDIGKFYQRGNETLLPNFSINAMGSELCHPNKSGVYGYKHVLWTYQFIMKDLPLFGPTGYLNREELSQLSAHHHKPKNETQGIIQLADSMASFVDRSAKPETEDKKSWFNEKPLISITTHILLQNILRKYSSSNQFAQKKDIADFIPKLYDEIKKHYTTYGYNLKPLSINPEIIFPIKKQDINDLPQQYQNLVKEFKTELEKIPTQESQSFINTLYYLLKKYLWCIPSSTVDLPDISLFEHSKMVAAMSVCLYDYYHQHKDKFNYDASRKMRLSLNKETETFLLVCGDLSGIQKYIYNILSSKAKKSLKGRSFYLEMASKIYARYILKELGYFQANEIYSSGGKFYLLLPNLDSIRNKLNEIRNKITEEIFNNATGDYYLCLDYVPFGIFYDAPNYQMVLHSSEPDKNGNPISDIGSLWVALSEKTSRHKYQKYLHLIAGEGYEKFFGKNDKGLPLSSNLVCQVTGETIDNSKYNEQEYILNYKTYKNGSEDAVYVLPRVKKQAELGERLAKAKYIVIGMPDEKLLHSPDIQPIENDLSIWIIDDNKENHLLQRARESNNYEILLLNYSDENYNLDFLKDAKKKNDKCSWGYFFYGGNTGNDKTIEELCRVSEKGEGFTRLGVLRMDVDNLGNTFQHGLESEMAEIPIDWNHSDSVLTTKNLYIELDEYKKIRNEIEKQKFETARNALRHKKKSFSALTTLSEQFSMFFSGYLNYLREKEEYKDWCQIIYSGGDDLFILGRWDKVIELAADIRNDFKKFSCSVLLQDIEWKQITEKIKNENTNLRHIADDFYLFISDYNDFGLSGGVALVTEKYPIQRAAELSGEAEDDAKSFGEDKDKKNPAKKNAITLFGEPISWAGEYDYVFDWKNKFVDWLNTGIISKGILQKLFSYLEKKKQGKLEWMWHLNYLFARHENENNKEQLKSLKENIICGKRNDKWKIGSDRSLLLICLAARWAELQIRTEEFVPELTVELEI